MSFVIPLAGQVIPFNFGAYAKVTPTFPAGSVPIAGTMLGTRRATAQLLRAFTTVAFAGANGVDVQFLYIVNGAPVTRTVSLRAGTSDVTVIVDDLIDAGSLVVITYVEVGGPIVGDHSTFAAINGVWE